MNRSRKALELHGDLFRGGAADVVVAGVDDDEAWSYGMTMRST